MRKRKYKKTFVVDNETLGNKIKKLINQIPDGVFEITDEIITYAITKLDTELDKQIYVSLSDHIAFAIKRYNNKIPLKNDLLNEIRRVHKKEFKVALWAVDYINSKLNIDLPEDESGFIALHFVNASYNGSPIETITSTKIIKDILNIIRYYCSLEFDEDDLNYDRLLTHLKYFAKRVISNNQHVSSDENFMEMVSKSYPHSYSCSLKIKEYIKTNYDYIVNGDELVYLTMHIQRVVTAAKGNR